MLTGVTTLLFIAFFGTVFSLSRLGAKDFIGSCKFREYVYLDGHSFTYIGGDEYFCTCVQGVVKCTGGGWRS
ncbi:hypothetical protein DPMN_047774 [Dreissena polymorpha]|uniref:Uncharacterized protein n=1 Tax=Dreissena polymorpha TaxID=45954 RepID=A0A9D4I3D8_DREPO|nr:hypothetical protein DPMN_047774 [Dreissena polymorpha]